MSSATTADGGETLAELLEQLPGDLAGQAFTHSSWVANRADSYQRLAFLGDVVLSLAVSTHLFPRLADFGAGRLTKVRAQTVSGAACAEVGIALGVPERLRAQAPDDCGERSLEMLTASERVLASITEAVIGAVYLAFGFERVAPAVVSAFADQIDAALDHSVDHKSLLQERLARRAEIVEYAIASEEGPAHDRHFVAIAKVGGREIGRGEGRTKKVAEQEAAARALEMLDGEAG